MCGINGVFNYESVDAIEKKVKSMNDLTQYRGPDYSDLYQDQKVCLAHNRLAIIDLEQYSNQPFISNDKNVIFHIMEKFIIF